jgi:2',3'-cyclic-nucleotide 2'-phosphodiesterase (5'-nucleotidase family)
MKITQYWILLCIFCFFSCTGLKKLDAGQGDGKIEIIFLQLNDVYEIAPIENGKAGGLARVAYLRKQLLKENPNTVTVLAGDFVNPSLIGTLKQDGKSIKGKHIIESLNSLGLDYVCFGNHEFDLDYKDLQNRINESKFEWLGGNVLAIDSVVDVNTGIKNEYIHPFFKSYNNENTFFKNEKILYFKDADGTTVQIGLFAATIDANQREFVRYLDAFKSCKSSIDRLKGLEERPADMMNQPKPAVADAIIGLTHLPLWDDKEVARQNPAVKLIMGGHEHSNMKHKVEKTHITKADANAKTVWVHRFKINKKTQKVCLKSKLVNIDDTMPEDSATALVVKKWTDIATQIFQKSGFNPNEVIATLSEALDGREASLRFQQVNIGKLVTESMLAVAKNKTDCAFFNSGAIRIDDQIGGKITQADILRMMPFGGKFVEMDIIGSELKKVLYAGLLNRGRGGYLQWSGISFSDTDKSFKINNLPLDVNKKYHIITNDFLLTGKESNLPFFTESNPNISNLSKSDPADASDLRNNMQQAVIHFLKQKNK